MMHITEDRRRDLFALFDPLAVSEELLSRLHGLLTSGVEDLESEGGTGDTAKASPRQYDVGLRSVSSADVASSFVLLVLELRKPKPFERMVRRDMAGVKGPGKDLHVPELSV